MEKREFLNYFVWKGVKYYTGTVIVVNDMGRPVEAAFVCYDKTYNHYVYKIKDWQCSVRPNQFKELLIEVTNKRNDKVRMPAVKTLKDSQIDGLFLGWVWYIFLMAVSTIFKYNFLWWALISFGFFTMRADKIKKEGEYIEW